MNATRKRAGIIQRAGCRSSCMGVAYINGTAYNPRVLIALINMWRMHYNFFDRKPWRTPPEAEAVTMESPIAEAMKDDAEPA